MRFIHSLKLAGLLSFPPDMEPFELESLNVLIGPNGSGKSNLIEAFELLKALPTDFAAAVRQGGGVLDWIWKGESQARLAQIGLTGVNLESDKLFGTYSAIDYLIEFQEMFDQVDIGKEVISKPNEEKEDEPLIYFGNGPELFNIKVLEESGREMSYRQLTVSDFSFNQSILSQLKDPIKYRHLTSLGRRFSSIQTFREWSFGRDAELRRPQRADLPDDRLLPDNQNLAMVLNKVEHHEGKKFDELLRRFFPRFERMTTRVSGGTVQFYLHEKGFSSPIPATRISDGTLRFIAMLAVLLSPEPPPLVCIEEPELGLHPDAVALMGDVLEEASERMQLVVTTHSDALVSELTNRPSAIVACERPGAGTMLRRLDPEHVAHWLDEYALGDIWRMGALGANP